MNDVLQNKHLPWNWKYISHNPNITPDFIYLYQFENLDWDYMSSHSHLSLEIIEQLNQRPWSWSEISRNHNLTYQYIEENPHLNWNWSNLVKNTFPKEKKLYLEKKYRQYMAVYKIKKLWLQHYYNPRSTIGKQRLERSLSEFH